MTGVIGNPDPPRAGEPGRAVGVGADFGTSNSAVAWFDGQRLHYVQLEATGPILPTAIHLNREYEALTGSSAIEQYVEENRGRLVELVPEVIGELATEISGASLGERDGEPEQNRSLVYGQLYDRGLPGRLFLGLKRLLGDARTDRLSVFRRAYRLVALITPVLLRMREGAQKALGTRVESIHIGRPVNFEGLDPGRNALALSRLSEASRYAGLRGIHFFPEPIAATLSFLWRARPDKPGVALTVDFGGGTLDLSVIRYRGAEFDVLSTEGAGLGGNRIDQLIFQHMLFPLLGKGETWARQLDGRRVQTPFPFEEFEHGLLNWPITHLLNQGKTKSKVVDRIARGGAGVEKFERLKDLISYNYSYNCFQAIRTAKAALSEVEATVIDIPELNLQVPFTRAQFNTLLQQPLEVTGRLIDSVIAAAGLTHTDIDLVIRTGGSSLIVAVRELLEARFPGKVTGHDPFTSVAGGLAIANYYGLRHLTPPP
jgi:hypothetical chaperone protein